VFDMETGVRHETLTSREWLRAGAGNDTMKETEDTEYTQNRTLQEESELATMFTWDLCRPGDTFFAHCWCPPHEVTLEEK